MNRTLNLILAIAAFIMLALAAAVGVGTGEFALPAILVVICLCLGWLVTIGRKLPLDALVVIGAVGMFYCLGKGFAYLNVGGLFFSGEAALAFGLLAYLWRVGRGDFRILPASSLTLPILMLGGYALLRLPYDFNRYGIMALRDACMIYYTIFFFIAYQLGRDERVQRTAPTFLMIMVLPGVAYELVSLFSRGTAIAISQAIVVKGNPLILPHVDALHPGVIGLILYLAIRGTQAERGRLIALLLMLLVSAYILALGRGAIFVAFGFLALFLIAARRYKALLALAAGISGMIVALLIVAEVAPDVGKERIQKVKEQLLVIVNPASAKSVRSGEAATVDWRFAWWTKIFNDVNANNPVFGFGFGADITSDFVREHYSRSSAGEDAARTRAPHNAFFTSLGRMGWLGASLFVIVNIAILRVFWRAIAAFRSGLMPPSQGFFWGSNIAGFTITYFQYAWEAPYSAIPYWVCMGLSFSYLDSIGRAHDRESSLTLAAPESGEVNLRSLRPRLANSADVSH